MFHILLVLPVLILIAIIISFFLFGLLVFTAGLIGGVSTAYLVKNKLSKRLLFVGFSILSFIGLLPVLPLIMAYMNVPLRHIAVIIIAMLSCVGVLSAIGIKLSRGINNKYVKLLLIVIFCVVLVFDMLFIIFTPVVSNFLLSASSALA